MHDDSDDNYRGRQLRAPDAAVDFFCTADGVTWRPVPRAAIIQQRLPNLSHNQLRRQPLGPQFIQNCRQESRFAAELQLFQCYEERGLRLE